MSCKHLRTWCLPPREWSHFACFQTWTILLFQYLAHNVYLFYLPSCLYSISGNCFTHSKVWIIIFVWIFILFTWRFLTTNLTHPTHLMKECFWNNLISTLCYVYTLVGCLTMILLKGHLILHIIPVFLISVGSKKACLPSIIC